MNLKNIIVVLSVVVCLASAGLSNLTMNANNYAFEQRFESMSSQLEQFNDIAAAQDYATQVAHVAVSQTQRADGLEATLQQAFGQIQTMGTIMNARGAYIQQLREFIDSNDLEAPRFKVSDDNEN